MGIYEIISLVLNLVFGGGLIVTVFTLRAVRREAKAKAKAAELENAEKAAAIVMEQIAEPLRKELKRVNRELSRLRSAIEKGYNCSYRGTCPIIHGLQESEDDGRDYDEGRGIGAGARHGDSGSS